MTKYDDSKWLEPKKATPFLHEQEPTLDISALEKRIAKLEAELTALIEVISETCRAGEAARQTMPPSLAKWWAEHKK